MDVQVGDIIKLENNQFVTVSQPQLNYRFTGPDEDFSPDLLSNFRLTFCCSAAVNLSTWCTSRPRNWTG